MRARALRTALTDAECRLWLRLRNRQLAGMKFRRQHPIGPYVADFACIEAGLVVEVDGGQHFDPEGLARDAQRSLALNAAGFRVLRFDNRQVLMETEGVLSVIRQWLQTHHPHPNPLPQAGEGVERGRHPHPNPLPQAGEGVERGHLSYPDPLPQAE